VHVADAVGKLGHPIALLIGRRTGETTASNTGLSTGEGDRNKLDAAYFAEQFFERFGEPVPRSSTVSVPDSASRTLDGVLL